jgi:hypothetical protein
MRMVQPSFGTRSSDHHVYKYVRPVKRRFQARLRWADGPDGDCSIGIYSSSREAWQAVSGVLSRLDPGRAISLEHIWEATLKSIAAGKVNPCVLPKYVQIVPGDGFRGRLARGGHVWITPVFPDPLQAHRAAVELREQLRRQGRLPNRGKRVSRRAGQA